MALTDALYQIDPNSMVLAVFFVITFALLMFILRRTGIGKNNATATVISLCISLLATYGITRTNFDLNGFVYNLGISEDTLYIIGPIAALFFIFLISRRKDPKTGRRKFSLGRFLMILGALMFILGFTPLIYRKAFFIGVGAGLIALGGIILKRKEIRFPKGSERDGTLETPQEAKRNNEAELRKQGIDALIKAARRFKSWALRQKNPKFVGSWAMFINYLKRGGWGGSEESICQRLHITQDDFVRIFNRYGKV